MPRPSTTTKFAIGIATILVTASGLAEPNPTATLVYRRAPDAGSCPAESELRSRVSERLGTDPFVSAAPLRIEAYLARRKGEFLGTVRLLDITDRPAGERQMTAPACSELVDAMAASISILLDSRLYDRRAGAVQGSSGGQTVDREPRVSRVTPQDRHAAPAPLEAPLAIRFGASAVGSLGAAPAAAFGLATTLGVSRGNLSLDLEGRIDLPAETRRSDGTGVSSSLMLAELLACFHRSWFITCPLFAIGALQGRGIAVEAPRDRTTLYAAAGFRIGAELPVADKLAFRVGADLIAPLTRTRLSAAGETIWTTPAVFESLNVGVLGAYP